MLDKKLRIRRTRLHLGEVLKTKVAVKEDYFLPHQLTTINVLSDIWSLNVF